MMNPVGAEMVRGNRGKKEPGRVNAPTVPVVAAVVLFTCNVLPPDLSYFIFSPSHHPSISFSLLICSLYPTTHLKLMSLSSMQPSYSAQRAAMTTKHIVRSYFEAFYVASYRIER